jgi:glycosyltransferase involved in cell wall biosynthesis
MKILVTNNHLDRLGGSETFTYTLAKELSERGHDVDVFSFHLGTMSDLISEFCHVTKDLKCTYDLILINHNTCLRHIKDIKGTKVFTSHGVYPPREQPEDGADFYVGISEEIIDHNEREMALIHNGVDCEVFKPTREINKELKTVYSLCQGAKANSMLQQACARMGVLLLKTDNREWGVEEMINKADLVVTLGRGAYESMACGRNVLVFDTRSYTEHKTSDGLVTPENADELLKNNFSGRRFKTKVDISDIIEELKGYKQEYGKFNRDYALAHFNITKQVNEYLKLTGK